MLTGCHDCDRLTGGRCWRHSVTTIPTGFVQVIPSTTIAPTVVPLTPFEYPTTVPR